jgi:IstB-like ATP binding protein
MNTSIAAAPSIIDRVKRNLVDLKMPRALEILDVTLRGIERGEITALEAIDTLLAEELALRENRRVKMALQMARLSAIKTLAGFDFSFQPSLDKNRVMALAELQFIDRAEAVHLIGPPGTGKTHLSLALGVEAIKAGRSVYFGSLADIVAALARAEREGALRQKIRYFCRFSLLIVDEIGYLPVIPGGGQSVLPAHQRPRRKRRHDPHLEPRLCRMRRNLRRSSRRHSAARPAATPCHRGVELSAARACRPGARTHPLKVQHPIAYTADTAPAWSAAKKWRRRSRQRLITMPAKLGNFTSALLGKIRLALTLPARDHVPVPLSEDLAGGPRDRRPHSAHRRSTHQHRRNRVLAGARGMAACRSSVTQGLSRRSDKELLSRPASGGGRQTLALRPAVAWIRRTA